MLHGRDPVAAPDVGTGITLQNATDLRVTFIASDEKKARKCFRRWLTDVRTRTASAPGESRTKKWPLDDPASVHFVGTARTRVDGRHGTARHGTARHGTARHGTARHGTARHGTERNGTERNGTERNGTERNGTERNGTERNGTERNGTATAVATVQLLLFIGATTATYSYYTAIAINTVIGTTTAIARATIHH